MTLSIDDKYLNQHYAIFRDYLENICGIRLGDNKQYLVSSRLEKILGKYKIANLTELIEKIDSGKDSSLKSHIIDAMTTNETLWFRDGHPFNLLSEHILPRLLQRKNHKGQIRIWSAASSSGQEPYSISIVLSEYSRANPGVLLRDIEITATDICHKVLEIAKNAEYDLFSVGRGLSSERKELFFERLADKDHYKLNKPERERVKFQQLNLLDDFLFLGKFDVIFCRNVLIYFSEDVKQDILYRLSNSLNPNGFLILGSTESINNANKYYKMLRLGASVIYTLPS